MEKDHILRMTGTYLKIIETIGRSPLIHTPSVDEVVENKSLKQKIYREIKEIAFPGTLIDYACWISTAYLIDLVRPFMKENSTLTDWTLAIVSNYENYPDHTRNAVRLFGSFDYFFSVMKSEIMGVPLVFDLESEYGSASVEEMKEIMRVASAFGSFIEVLVYEDMVGRKAGNFVELMEFLKGAISKSMS